MREFVWCRQEVAEECRRNEEHSHICIGSPGATPIALKCFGHAIQLFFHDLDPDTVRRSYKGEANQERAEEIAAHCMTEAQAREIAAFAEATEGLLVVNCEAGVSRSPGVVLALRRKYGGDTEEVFKGACPNIYVASMLGRVLGVGPFQPRKHEGIAGAYIRRRTQGVKNHCNGEECEKWAYEEDPCDCLCARCSDWREELERRKSTEGGKA